MAHTILLLSIAMTFSAHTSGPLQDDDPHSGTVLEPSMTPFDEVTSPAASSTPVNPSNGLNIAAGLTADTISDQPACRPVHLVVLIHGLFGSSADLRNLANAIRTNHPSIVLDLPEVNHGRTRSGIISQSTGLFSHVTDKIQECRATHLSIIGHSLGGITGRFLVHILAEKKIIPDVVTPVHFITIATPHLGMLRWARGFMACIATAAAFLFGPAFQELILCDSVENPLLLEMTSDLFLRSLNLFKQRFTYGCARFDAIVSYESAGLNRINPFELIDYGKKPRLLADKEEIPDLSIEDALKFHTQREETMMTNLNKLKWTKIAIVPIPSLSAHSDVVGKVRGESSIYCDNIIADIVHRFA
uniref:DUF676 domain-containing protein n=1 Tax=Spongospora subterranea TaxID=70186 RepID=A0A0H5QS96_9EUKA|eukprot:CRZ04892.1 hypothetical protein [Spongospora subterranea]